VSLSQCWACAALDRHHKPLHRLSVRLGKSAPTKLDANYLHTYGQMEDGPWNQNNNLAMHLCFPLLPRPGHRAALLLGVLWG
jgi:hypothetical protein